MAHFGEAERNIAHLLSVGNEFYDTSGEKFQIYISGKPTCSSGEPKTDIYVGAQSSSGRNLELKISFKKENADFLENKTSADRAEQIFGSQWKSVVEQSTLSIENSFYQRPLIYKNKDGRTEKGSITLGWKFELMNKTSGNLSGRIALSSEQKVDIYAGSNLDNDKKNAYVCGQQRHNSGVANYILTTSRVNSAQEVVDNLMNIVAFANEQPPIYFACKALNYRTFANKYDGDRPLAVFIKWFVNNGKLTHQYVFNAPLVTRGNSVAECLLRSMRNLGIRTTDDINNLNVADPRIIF